MGKADELALVYQEKAGIRVSPRLSLLRTSSYGGGITDLRKQPAKDHLLVEGERMEGFISVLKSLSCLLASLGDVKQDLQAGVLQN